MSAAMTNAEIVTRCSAIRETRKPLECRGAERGFTGPCWITAPYQALGGGLHCKGCGGLIDPNGFGAPSFQELQAVGIAR